MSVPPVISVIGDLAVDYVLQVAAEAAADEKARLTSVQRYAGGTSGNSATAAAKLGAKVRLHSIVGDDAEAQWLLAQTAAAGVDVTFVQHARGPSAQAFIVNAPDGRTVYTLMTVMDQFQSIDLDSVRDADLIYVGYSPTIAQQLLASELADRTVVGFEAWMLHEIHNLAILDRAALVITNEAGWQALRVGSRPTAITIETRGAAGAAIHHLGATTAIPPLRVTAVDATGAGDAFAGAVCTYYAAGETIDAATRLATAAGALATRCVGARNAQPTDHDVRRALQRPTTELTD